MAGKAKAAKKKSGGKTGGGGGAKKAKKEPRKSFAYDGKTVIVTATLSDIKKAEKGKGEVDSKKLVRVPSKVVKDKLYKEAAEAIAEREAAALPSHGGRPWKCDVRVVDDGRSKRKFSSALFRWYRGRLELAVVPHYLEKIEEVDSGIKWNKRHRDDPEPESSEEEDEDDLYPHIPKTMLSQREVSALSQIAWEEPDHPVPEVKRTWRSPDLKTFNSRKAAIDHARVLVKRDKMVDKVIHGFGGHGLMVRPVKVTKKAALDAGLFRFWRDGLWVIGQEDEWLEEALDVWKVREANREKREEREAAEAEVEAEGKEDAKTGITGMDMEKEGARTGTSIPTDELEAEEKEDAKTGIVMEKEGASTGTSIPAVEDKKLSSEGRISTPKANSNVNVSQEDSGNAAAVSSTAPAPVLTASVEDHGNDGPPEKKLKSSHDSEAPSTKQTMAVTDITSSKPSKKVTSTPNNDDSADAQSKSSLTPGSAVLDCEKAGETPTAAASENGTSNDTAAPEVVAASSTASESGNGASATAEAKKKKAPKPKGPRKIPKIAKSTHWRLNEEQIQKCHVAVIDHYEKVMRTVKAKNLYFELRDGFDVCRERGQGRYDMELDAFDKPEFDFLTDLNKAAWMPVVRKILGDDAMLVHKGAFLSLPGSDTQIYHQDGVHLHKSVQKPCHAVNVFIPLVDLELNNGPTEFCLGTHFLGYEGFSREMIYTPCPKAGTPIIFDYRLGHRGLGNSSSESRPIVYLTYTPASSNFKDSVNFSRSRYKKLGEMVDRPLSRKERALKREREVEEKKQEPDEEIANPTPEPAPAAPAAPNTSSANSTAQQQAPPPPQTAPASVTVTTTATVTPATATASAPAPAPFVAATTAAPVARSVPAVSAVSSAILAGLSQGSISANGAMPAMGAYGALPTGTYGTGISAVLPTAQRQQQHPASGVTSFATSSAATKGTK